MFIIPVTGNIKFPITLDASVWIFDERRIKFEDVFSKENFEDKETKEQKFSSAERFNREVYEATNENKPIPRKDADEILSNTYVIPFKDFYHNIEVNENASDATIILGDGEEVILTLNQLEESFFLYSYKGKPLREDGPVHIYFGDGSNQDNPIKRVKKIIIN